VKQIKAAICDDEILVLPYMVSAIQEEFLEYDIKLMIESYSEADKFIQMIESGKKYDICFLDIDIPKYNGIEIAQKIINTRHHNTMIIFISAKEDMVFQTFKVSPTAFIRKNQFMEDVKENVRYLCKNYFKDKEDPHCFTDAFGHVIFSELTKIMYIEAKDKYIDIVTTKNVKVVRQTITKMEKELEDYQFIRIHKSYLVNHKYIYKIKESSLVLDNGQVLPISRRRMVDVKYKFCFYSG